jgi:hypothetical protein
MKGPPPYRDPDGLRRRFRRVSTEQAAAIGHVAINWTLVEEALADMIWAFLNIHVDEVRHSVTAELNSLTRVAMIRSMIATMQNQEWL